MADQGVTCTNVQVPTRNTKKLNYLSSSDRLPRSNIGQICEKSMKPHENGKFSFGALVGYIGPDVVCILASWEEIHKIHCVFSPSPNTQNTDLPPRVLFRRAPASGESCSDGARPFQSSLVPGCWAQWLGRRRVCAVDRGVEGGP